MDACYLRRLWEAETSACLRLNGLLAATVDTSRQADRTLAEIETEAGITYAPQQRQAVRLAAERGVLILTAGADREAAEANAGGMRMEQEVIFNGQILTLTRFWATGEPCLWITDPRFNQVCKKQ